ncbi:terminase gpA endonuclease subunit [Escherichia coli]
MLKPCVNTTLGETWEAKIGERPDAEVMAERKDLVTIFLTVWLT